MKFYRLATEEDFRSYDLNIDCFQTQLPNEVEQIIKNGELNKAVKTFRKTTGRGLQECKKYCSEYFSFLNAKKDFYDGKPVYTEY